MTRRSARNPRPKPSDSWNEGARKLEFERSRLGETVEAFGSRFRLERTYMGRLLSGERLPGWKLRDQFRTDFGIDPGAFEKKCRYPEKPAKPAA